MMNMMMRGAISKVSKVVVVVAIYLSLPLSAAGATGDEILREMTSAIGWFKCYDVDFTLSVEGQKGEISGSYTVDGGRYMLTMSNYKIYGEGGVRYSVDEGSREVVIERLDTSMPMVVANPAKAFVELNDQYNSEVVTVVADYAVLKLLPKESNELIREVTLVVSTKTKLPKSILYNTGAEEASVEIISVRQSASRIPAVDSIAYPEGFEVIDLR